MVRPDDGCGTALENGAAVLMARIVDNAGKTIRRADVGKIEYSIYEFDHGLRRGRRVLARHDGVALHVGDVLFDTLQNCGLWSLDAVGYNFRHAFDIEPNNTQVTAGKHFEICYEFKPMFGQKMKIRFQLGSLLQ